ncbi:class II aldolase/adducin family protein [Mesorhizobium australicum]|uniref:HCOMODA/2-hydroxy-3-carboxy-muconic semialdehyde decarboxylase n=1 Tax=Mesorhizobium australicum TaxID=536018 RepID=A0A1X7N5T8_9HYPH|nr:class II aldolase/adducin family protein [Mesorhizobium australicum]SMH32792.1 HCOMODA/2-hydroxy-3-carboxy-muconic semialdehyde decarboxylase [Mesorhizobium australicum]
MHDDAIVRTTIQELVIANRALAAENVIDDFGHVSARHPLRPDRFLLSRSRSPMLVSADDIMEFELDGTPVDQNGRRVYAERFIHAAIFAARPEVNCVTHHHARSVLPFTVTDTVLRPMFHMASVIGHAVPVWESQDEFGDTNMLVDTLPMGESLARALGDGTCALLRGHGAVCAASTIAGACLVSVYLKENAEMVLNALPLGAPRYLTAGEVDKAAAMLLSPMPLERAWTYRKAKAGFHGL